MLSKLEDKSQEKLSNYTKGVLQSGISTEEGMYGVLKNGVFLQKTIEKTQFNLQVSFEAVIKLRLLAAILRAQVCIDLHSFFLLHQTEHSCILSQCSGITPIMAEYFHHPK
jgi:hypothetical protein